MTKFYVNEIYDSYLKNKAGVAYGHSLIGLFKQCATEGRGSFCGYYGSEFYLDTELYAYYIAEGGIYRPEDRLSELEICVPPIKYREVQIGSHLWTTVIEAETVRDAIELFRDAKWRRWRSPEDECRQSSRT